MPYFADHHEKLRYPLAGAATRGLYNAQSGAIHALISHFTIDDQAAIVTMPTGSGKTAVSMMLPFALRSLRVLIITPSRLVTGQIAEDFTSLQTLRELEVVPEDLALPRVHELRERISSLDDWEALRDYDVVVSTPNCSSPGYAGIPAPPNDLFDLVIIDEAHHSPAQTWTELLNSLAHCKRALFSATPFRRDRAEIKGKFVYSYPIAKAYGDGIFGRLEYVKVDPTNTESNDLAVARKAAEVFHADRQAGLNHCIMVRTDQKKKADELALLYEKNTDLRLRVVHSGLSNTTIKKVLNALEANELDGVICVNMMGEGVNYPRLKIAAIHSPHKSLEVTLQFIGRFARTNVPGLGAAKFIAVLSDIEVERARLFDEGAVWQDIVPALSYGRIANELRVREVLQEFTTPDGTEDFSDLSLYSLYPRSHVKIYDVPGPVNFQNVPIDLDNNRELCYRAVTDDGHVTVLVGRALGRPKWSSGDAFVDVGYDLYVVFYDSDSHLLFINSSRSVDGTYDHIIGQIDAGAKALPTGQVGRVVKDIENKRIFNIGMRNIHAANTRESYKILAASDAHIDPSEGRSYRQGHVFIAGEEDGQKKTIGYSSGGKVWSSTSQQIPELLDWCKALGAKIRSEGALVTNSGLDYLDAGRVVDALPDHLVYVEWDKSAYDYADPATIHYVRDDGEIHHGHILDLELALDSTHTTPTRIRVNVIGEGIHLPIDFSLDDWYSAPLGGEDRITVTRGTSSATLLEYLSENYLQFFTADHALLSGNELFAPKSVPTPIAADQLRVWDWVGVDIEHEVGTVQGSRSIHDGVKMRLEQGDAAAIIYDHGSGEVADFVAIGLRGNAVCFDFYHCKASGGHAPGARVADLYEVCGQAQKSVALASVSKLERRLHDRRPLNFARGNAETLAAMFAQAKNSVPKFTITVVQPGISKAALSDPMGECLGATNSHLIKLGIDPLIVATSA